MQPEIALWEFGVLTPALEQRSRILGILSQLFQSWFGNHIKLQTPDNFGKVIRGAESLKAKGTALSRTSGELSNEN